MWLYIAGERLSRSELMAARLDGDVVEVGDAFIPADAVETAHLRAASLRELVPHTLAVTHASAAWVHGAIDEPPVVHRVQRASAHRIPSVVALRLNYRDGRVPEGDVEMIGGVAVTTPVRTAADLARDVAAGSADSACTLDALAAWRPGIVREALDWFAGSAPLHHKRPAVRLLSERLAAQEEVTRYTS